MLAAFPAEAGTGRSEKSRLSLLEELPVGRTCREAGIPKAYCACRQEMG